MAEEEGDDGLGEEVGHGSVKHPAQGADAVVQLGHSADAIRLDMLTRAYHAL